MNIQQQTNERLRTDTEKVMDSIFEKKRTACFSCGDEAGENEYCEKCWKTDKKEAYLRASIFGVGAMEMALSYFPNDPEINWLKKDIETVTSLMKNLIQNKRNG